MIGSPEADDEFNTVVKNLLKQTRIGINAGNRDAALACLVNAIALTKGPDMVLETLSAGKKKAQEARDLEAAEAKALIDLVNVNSRNLVRNDSILKERDDGSVAILRDAFQDGSSVICMKCNALVQRTRWDVHSTTWCSSLSLDSDEGGYEVDN